MLRRGAAREQFDCKYDPPDNNHDKNTDLDAVPLEETPLALFFIKLVIKRHSMSAGDYFDGGLVAKPTWVMPKRPRTSKTFITPWYWVRPSPLTTTGKSGVWDFC